MKQVVVGLWLFLFSTIVFAQVTAIKAGRLIDPDQGKVLTDQVILIRDQ